MVIQSMNYSIPMPKAGNNYKSAYLLYRPAMEVVRFRIFTVQYRTEAVSYKNNLLFLLILTLASILNEQADFLY